MNNQTYNQVTLHVGSQGCEFGDDADVTGEIVEENTSCYVTQDSNLGCSYRDNSSKSYGTGFNEAQGGVFALLFTSEEIAVWFWSREDVPDTVADSPDTASFGTPVARWPKTSCDIDKYFAAQELIFDCTLCGQWAGHE